MLIILLILYSFIEDLFQKLWNFIPRTQVEIKKQITIDQSIIEIFLGSNISYSSIQ